MEWVVVNKVWMRLKRIQGDGNCLFAALIDQARMLKIKESENWDVWSLRQLVVKYITEHPKKFINVILSSICDLAPRYDNLSLVQRKKNFIEDLTKDGFWGGAESIIAVSNISGASIKIHQKGVPVLEFKPDERDPMATINLLFSGKEGMEANHYDSIWPDNAGSDFQSNISQDVLISTWIGPDVPILSCNEIRQKTAFYPQLILTPDKEFQVEQREPEISVSSQARKDKTKIATWNVRGCRNEEKRKVIIGILKEEGVAIAGLQETHMIEGQYLSPNSQWYLSGGNQGLTYRGTAIVILNNEAQMESFYPINENLAAGILTILGKRVSLITCHIPSEHQKAKVTFGILSSWLTELSKSGGPIFIVGDFNAHLGYQEVRGKDDRLIGSMLKHQHSNENGQLLRNLIILHNLTVSTSWSQSKSVLTTWTNESSESQLDHILSVNMYPGFTAWCKAKWFKKCSDHKMVFANVFRKVGDKSQISKYHKPTGDRKWNIKNLKVSECNSLYKGRIRAELEAHGDLSMSVVQGEPSSRDKWEDVCTLVADIAQETLNCPLSPMTPNRRRSMAEQKRARFWKKRFPNHSEYGKILVEKNRARTIAFKNHVINRCSKFFRNLPATHPSVRLHETFKFLKQFKRKTRKRISFIPMVKWEEELSLEGREETINILEEETNLELIPPFPKARISAIIQGFKRGTAPGVDRMNIELLQEGPIELIKVVTEILEEAWVLNKLPEAWIHTIQIPIPKVKNPKNTEDYRKISLCSIAYKIYAKLLLEALDEIIPPLPQYQGAFLSNRSAEDHIYTIRRITEEAWNEGRIIYILALDIARAFPSVNHKALVSILKRHGVPIYLINRIIKACLHEKTAIQWFGQTTVFHKKSVGVKQGCPISPRLFTIVLNEVIETTVEVLWHFDLNEKDHVSLPMLFAYADDLIILAEEEELLEKFLEEIIPNLQSTGLSLNLKKCEIMIRDPKGIVNKRKDDTILLNKKEIKVVQTMRYLGAYLTSTVNRKGSTRIRIEKAIGATRAIIPFIKKYTPPWYLIRNMYNSMIVPVALYGMKVTATTRANRIALRNMERLVLSLLAQHCSRVPSARITSLLRGRTIWRKVMAQRIKYWAHIRRRSHNHILQVASRICPSLRKIGRPCFSWNDSLREDIIRSKIPESEWEEVMNDKEKVKKLTNKIYEIIDSSDDEEITLL